MPQRDSPKGAAPLLHTVTEAESGQKILQCLQRRLHLPQNLLHRWLRTGQVRLNGGRCKAFTRITTGDIIRLPPFALKMAAQSGASPAISTNSKQSPLPPLLGESGDILAFFKPAGLPTHPGTGHRDSLASRLHTYYMQADFIPTPAHRLDRDTSGVLLVAASYTALRTVQDSIRQGLLSKEYLAWVHGCWPWPEEHLLCHVLRKTVQQGFEKMRPVSLEDGMGKEARCLIRPLRRSPQNSLLQVHLLTGRTHQIRAQLALEGHPIMGDTKYGEALHSDGRMYLHSLRVSLPTRLHFACLPHWPAPYALDVMPPPMTATFAAVKNA
ncbi:MAG: RluA family pseudouridine synthase [Desulfovibrio sp.]|nr:RluA family pseudouridine synthase [Desulfovibrio sp.]